MKCQNVANGLQQCGERMRMRCLQIANTWRTDCNNATFKKQKPYFCNSKTPFLHPKNHTFVMRICNIQKTNTLQTFRECILNGLRMRGEQIAIMLQTDCHNILNKLQTHNQQPATNTKNTKNNLNITLAHAYYKTIFI